MNLKILIIIDAVFRALQLFLQVHILFVNREAVVEKSTGKFKATLRVVLQFTLSHIYTMLEVNALLAKVFLPSMDASNVVEADSQVLTKWFMSSLML